MFAETKVENFVKRLNSCLAILWILTSSSSLAEPSNEYRKDNDIGILALAPTLTFTDNTGQNPWGLSGGLRVERYFSRWFLADATIIYGQLNIKRAKSYLTTISVGAKYFLLNSLYLRGGLAGRRWNHRKTENRYYQDEDDVYQRERTYIRADVLSVGPELSFGNQWQLRRFVIGLEIINSFIPIAYHTLESSTVSDTTGESDRSYAKDFGMRGHASIPRLQLGAAF